MSRRPLLAAAATLVAVLAAPRISADLVMPGSWDLGTIGDGAPVSHSIAVQNSGRTALAIRLLSSCS